MLSNPFHFKVYNEQIRDLLVNSGPLAVREDAQKGVVVQGLTLHQVCLQTSFLACSNISLTREAPTPTNISTKSEPDMLKNGTFASPAIALANNVLPI